MNVTITNGQAVLSLSDPQEARVIEAAAAAYAKEKAAQAALAKVYTLKELATRMNIGRTTLLKYLNLPEVHGGIRHRRAGSTYLVSEQAVREWFGDKATGRKRWELPLDEQTD